MTEIKMLRAGGCVRDHLLGRDTKDIDFAVRAPSFEAMRDHLEAEGFHIFVESPQFKTVRARFPKGHKFGNLTCDFAMTRADGPSSDARRPDFVIDSDFKGDALRRDLTVNALFMDDNDEVIDFVGGLDDIATRTLRFVGDPIERLREDGLRALRFIRFLVTLPGFVADPDSIEAVTSVEVADLLGAVSAERVRDELTKAFRADTLATLDIVAGLPKVTREAMFKNGVRLDATMKS